MPAPLAIPLIAAGASVAGQAIGALSGANANKKNREFAQEMYNRQQADNERMWNMSNTYNSPQEQMKRLQEAGLNPNLVYGSGGQTGGTASPMSAPSADYNHKPTSFDLGAVAGSAFDAYFNSQLKSAQLDNLRAQNDVIRQEAVYKGVQTDALATTSGLNKDSYEYDLDYRRQRSFKMAAEHVIKENEAEIILKTKPHTIQLAAEKIAQMRTGRQLTREQIEKLNNDQEVQRMNIDLQKNGIRPNDEIYWRFLGTILSKLGLSIK